MNDLKSILDLILGQKEDRSKLLDVNVFRGVGKVITDYHLVVAKIRYLMRWPGRVVRMEKKYEIKVTRKTEYEEKLKQRLEMVVGSGRGSVGTRITWDE